jgi:hypothetical protein
MQRCSHPSTFPHGTIFVAGSFYAPWPPALTARTRAHIFAPFVKRAARRLILLDMPRNENINNV